MDKEALLQKPDGDIDIREVMAEAIRKSRAFLCYECGKCSGICPVARFDASFSPRSLLIRATRGETDKFVIGEFNRTLVQIPPGVWHGWVCLGSDISVVLNIPTEHYNYDEPDELRRPWDDPEIGFEWHPKGG